MNHEEAQALLEAYHDGQLGIADTVRIEAHVADCETCRGWLRERQSLRAQLRAAPLRYRLPDDLDAAIRAQSEPASSESAPNATAAAIAPARARRPMLAATWPRA
ncbi:MAG: zf-HC2 domain-containing protein, partial [Proteobacteria bacterium]|nr:zf-HC2 domain-containing protein [Pseudomonadota bacterium]